MSLIVKPQLRPYHKPPFWHHNNDELTFRYASLWFPYDSPMLPLSFPYASHMLLLPPLLLRSHFITITIDVSHGCTSKILLQQIHPLNANQWWQQQSAMAISLSSLQFGHAMEYIHDLHRKASPLHFCRKWTSSICPTPSTQMSLVWGEDAI